MKKIVTGPWQLKRQDTTSLLEMKLSRFFSWKNYILSDFHGVTYSICLREIKVGAGQTKGSWDRGQTASVFKVAIVYCKWAVCVNNSADTNGTELKWENKKHHIGPRPTSRSKGICIKLSEGSYRDCKKLCVKRKCFLNTHQLVYK